MTNGIGMKCMVATLMLLHILKGCSDIEAQKKIFTFLIVKILSTKTQQCV